ncbi:MULTISPECIES: GspH/FimT family pseudopilin [unclassified Pseudomonas]|uniref:GspH/FimT family pseudopilin n=1 Tax=unclassified Pseudomonas TaxID=196821 RepID=UPI002446DD4D|nr:MULTISPECIES: GspH/FimT family pseudopilin [unclassified Pseudomonas]MDH0304680.1 GspH/FimT family pseudopilin [Pseudomonas sp. GD04091]MDH1986945.1 GspH/FimT family pseudopilin [Pseudomonas sp. GD03689]
MKQQGVTLMQMMCTLAVASLLTQLGLTAYNNFSEEQHQAAVARELAQALRAARNQAALLRKAVLVEPLEGDWGKGWRISQEHDGQGLTEHRLPRPLLITTTSGRAVRFSRRGAPLGIGFGGTTLDICQRATRDSRHQVVLSPTGRVSLRSDGGRRCAGD